MLKKIIKKIKKKDKDKKSSDVIYQKPAQIKDVVGEVYSGM